ncbi:MAG: NAD-dependent epimerase/dehydratase family protein [Pseudomonadota bacterium]
MNGQDVLLLGGGFIGSTLARQLSAAGRTVHVLTRRPASAEFPQVHWHLGDMQDRPLLEQLLCASATVIHLASETTPGASARNPLQEAGNLLPTLTLLDALQDYPDAHLIYFSSGGTVYGNPACLPVAEDAPLAPLSFHGAGKAAQEMFLQALRAQGRAVTIMRPANAYGPGQPLKAGFGLVRTVLEKIRSGQPIEVWGDGEAVRDFVYVDDVAAACVLFVDRPDDSVTYNVGSGEGCSINALIRLAGEVSERTPQVIYRAARRSDVAKVVLDVSRLCATGWAPRTGLAEGLARTWLWLNQ